MDLNNGYSGNTYTLRQLLGESISIVIPDMQRDYCWGEDGSNGKVLPFMISLIKLYREKGKNSLGLLYGYENPKGSSHIHIIDGQQRLTTLYLLVGMLYRRTSRVDLRRMLISDYELTDDREPKLLYEARIEAMYFLSELVTNFFLNREGRLSQLENSSWYCSTYSTDPTVQNFIRAIRKIDEAIEHTCHYEGWDFDNFTDFVVDKLMFFYHDLGKRSTAEDMFVTINTTGEPLTLPQQIKAQLPNNPTDIARWEKMEQWAWEHRPDINAERPYTSDTRLTELIHIWERYSGKRAFEIALNPIEIYKFFLSYRTLCGSLPYLIDMKAENASEMFVVLPTLRYIEKWNLHDKDKDVIKDFAALLQNITRYQRVSPLDSDIETAYRLIETMPFPDLLSLLDIPEKTAPKILTNEETSKLRLIADNPGERKKVVEILRKGEKHPLLNGKLQKLIGWSIDKGTHKTNLKRLDRLINLVYEIWGTEIDKKTGLDNLRRAMLTLRHEGYPMKKRADSTLSLCWHEYEWQRLMIISPGVISQILERVADSRQHPEDVFRKMTGRFDDKSYPYFFLISSENLISQCLHRTLLHYCDPFIGFYTEEVTDTDTKHMTHWLVEGKQVKFDTGRWSVLRPYGNLCLYTDHKRLNVAVDIHYQPEKRRSYRIEVFNRGNSKEKEPLDLRILLNKTGRKFSFDKKNSKYFIIVPDSHAATGILHSLLWGC